MINESKDTLGNNNRLLIWTDNEMGKLATDIEDLLYTCDSV